MPLPERLQSDTSRSFTAFCDYCALGPGRSIDKLLQTYNSSVIAHPSTRMRGTLGYWSGKHDWQRRSQIYDQAAAAQEDADRAAIRRQRRAELEDADYAQGAAIRAWATELLELAPKFLRRSVSRVERDGVTTEIITLALAAGPGELARAAKLASDLQRLSVGEPTEIHRIVERELGAVLDTLQQQLSEEDYARIVAAIAGAGAA